MAISELGLEGGRSSEGGLGGIDAVDCESRILLVCTVVGLLMMSATRSGAGDNDFFSASGGVGVSRVVVGGRGAGLETPPTELVESGTRKLTVLGVLDIMKAVFQLISLA